MGMYTEFHFNAELKTDTPDLVLRTLRYMLGDLEEQPDLPAHPLFMPGTRVCFMLRCDSYYFDAKTYSKLYTEDLGEYIYLCIRCNFKNYSNEINKFIDWISPYLEKQEGDFLGFWRYEETEIPTLIYHKIP